MPIKAYSWYRKTIIEDLGIPLEASKILPCEKYIHYTKYAYKFPIHPLFGSEFAKLFMFIISLKRLVLWNYRKPNLMLQAICESQTEHLNNSPGFEGSYFTSGKTVMKMMKQLRNKC